MAMALSASVQRSNTMADRLPRALKQSTYSFKRSLSIYASQARRILKSQQLMNELGSLFTDPADRDEIQQGVLGQMLHLTQEAVVLPPYIALAIRPKPGVWEYVQVNTRDLSTRQLTTSEYLQLKESIIDEKWAKDDYVLELDLQPFNASFPSLTRPSSIGNGAQYLLRHLSSRILHDKESMQPLLDFLQTLTYSDEKLMVGASIDSKQKLQLALEQAEEILSDLPKDALFEDFHHRLREIGLQKGWGKNAQSALISINLLLEILQEPDPVTLSKFFERIPYAFNVVIFSPHGYFGEEKVLGLPDTGGQPQK